MYLMTLQMSDTQPSANAIQNERCVAREIDVSDISLMDIVTSSAVITTRLERLITLARTTTMVGILIRGAHSSIGILPALSTDVVENRSMLK
jgi:hypothetical protein